MTSLGGSWKVAGRLARREVRRHPWRHLLVTGLILVPVLAALVCFSVLATSHDLGERVRAFNFPDPDAISVSTDEWANAPIDAPDPVAAFGLPKGTRIEAAWSTGDWLVGHRERTDGGGPHLTGTEVIEVDPGSVEQERFVVEHGRLPRNEDEVLLTLPAARDGRWDIGDTVRSARSGRSFRVVGTGLLGSQRDRRAAAVTGLPDSYWRQPVLGLDYANVGDEVSQSTVADQQVTVWVTDPASRADLVRTSFQGPESASDLDGRLGPGVTMVSAALCAIVAVIASAAFAISSRRQLRSVGLLSTVGADPATIRRAMVLQGAIPGVAAGLAAVAITIIGAGWANASGVFERFAEVVGARVVVSVSGSLVVVLLGLGAGIAAAWQPARTASRIPTLSALAGRRPVGPVPTGVPVAGLILWACGACALILAFGSNQAGAVEQLQPFLVIGGVAAIALGGVGLAPMAVALLAPLAGRARGTWRMGLRGLTRHRMQSAATVAAVGVALAMPVGLLTARDTAQTPSSSDSSTVCCMPERGDLVPVFAGDHGGTQIQVWGALRTQKATAVTDELLEVLGPSSTVIRTVPIVDQTGEWRRVATIDEAAADAVLEPWASEAIAAGQAVSLIDTEGPVAFTAAGKTASLDAVPPPGSAEGVSVPMDADYLIGTGALQGVGADRPSDSVLVVRADALAWPERREVRRLAGYEPGAWNDPEEPTLTEVEDAVAAADAETVEPGDSVEVGIVSDGTEARDDYIASNPSTPRDRWNRALLALAVVSGVLALLVLTITLSLRAVDSEPDRRAALAAGVAPGSLRRQRAFEGVVLALLGAVLALPLGWIPVTAARIGLDGAADRDGVPGVGIALPGWEAIVFLLAPAVAAAVLWTVFPALAAAVRSARHRDLPDDLVPRF